MSGGVTVGELLQSRPETLGLDLEILARHAAASIAASQPAHPEDRPRARGLSRVPPARAACSCSAKARCGISSASTPQTAPTRCRTVCAHAIVPCVLITGGLRPLDEVIAKPSGAIFRFCAPSCPRPWRWPSHGDSRGQSRVRELLHGVLHRHPRARRADRRRERHRQERMRARPVVRGHRLVADDAVEVRRRARDHPSSAPARS